MIKLNFETLFSPALPSLIGLCVGRYVANSQNFFIAAIMVIIFAAIFFLFTQIVLYFLNYNIFERKIQGSWISISESKDQTKEAVYSICEFKYDDPKKLLSYSGFSFNGNSKISAEFKSTLTDVKPSERKLTYVYEGHSFDSESDTTIGLGFVRFFANTKGDYFTATGHFRGAGNEYRPIYYKLIKLTKEMCQELIKKDSIADAQDMRKMVDAFKVRDDLKP
ncbi:MAG: hypothetical protein AAF960_09025 [Bacteroidota bacterium]